MVVNRIFHTVVLAVLVTAITACGGGDDNDGPGNQAPVANAGSDATVEELTTVILDGSDTTDPNGLANLQYQWTQTAGSPTVTLANGNTSQASFTAPDVVFGSPQQLTFQLTVTDSDGESSNASVTITVQEPGPDVILSGTAEYEFVPANLNCRGLAFPSTQPRPIRGATLQVINAADTTDIIATTVLDDNGDYSVTVPSQMNVFIRVRAELKRSGVPSWDVEVRDNTSSTSLGLNSRPLYVLDTATFSTGMVDSVRDILAETGWDGNAYTGTRAAAPFSVLDTIYDGIQLVLGADASAVFEPLDAFWSVNNTLGSNSQNSSDDIDNGELTGSFYRGGDSFPGQLFLLGDASTDTEEFDINVIAHEWGHYFEDKFSRSDSRGGPHSLGNRLDMRLAFGEGWGTAIGAMATGDPQYCDTGDPNIEPGEPISGFGFNIENSSPGFGLQGWFNEITIARLLYDLWDTDADGADNDSMGFQPIYNVMTNQQDITPALTSIFSFATALKTNNPTFATFIDNLLVNADIDTDLTIYGDNEGNDASDMLNPNPQDVLPVYHDLVPDGSVVNVCSNSQFDDNRDGNKLSEYQYIRFNVTTADNYFINISNSNPWDTPPPGFDCVATFNANPNDPEAHRYSDPDFLVYQNGSLVAGGAACTPGVETDTAPLTTGIHIISLIEFRFADDQTVSGHPPSACFNVSVTPQ